MSKSYIVDANIPKDVLIDLNKYGNVYFSQNLPNIYKPVNSHPDIQIYFADKNTVFTSKLSEKYYKDILPNYMTVRGIGDNLGKSYPENVLLNIASFGNYIVCNKKYTSKDILDYYENTNKILVSVKQGYAKCNICIVSENAIITEDTGIYNKLIKYDIDVLLINPGGVKLDNFEYGFIGGASGFIDENIIGFIGKIENHPEFDKITNFIHKHNKKYVSLGSGGLKDCGSILMY